MRKINEIIIHCTATPADRDVTVAQLRRYHTETLGWRDIGYHYVVYRDGSVATGRPLGMAGAHCRGHNRNSIGVAYVGGLTARGGHAADTRTARQRTAMEALVNRLLERFPGATVRGHCDFATKSCPCFDATAEYAPLVKASRQ